MGESGRKAYQELFLMLLGHLFLPFFIQFSCLFAFSGGVKRQNLLTPLLVRSCAELIFYFFSFRPIGFG
jgi:hypothetical protein